MACLVSSHCTVRIHSDSLVKVYTDQAIVKMAEFVTDYNTTRYVKNQWIFLISKNTSRCSWQKCLRMITVVDQSVVELRNR